MPLCRALGRSLGILSKPSPSLMHTMLRTLVNILQVQTSGKRVSLFALNTRPSHNVQKPSAYFLPRTS